MASLATFALVPAIVCDPTTFTSLIVCPRSNPVAVASFFTNGVPSYIFDALAAVTVNSVFTFFHWAYSIFGIGRPFPTIISAPGWKAIPVPYALVFHPEN